MTNAALRVFLLTLVLSGCSRTAPVVADGKPVEHWLANIRSSDSNVRSEAVRKLGNIGSRAKEALPAVFQALQDADATVRKQAIFAVVRNAKSSAPALPVISRMKSEDPDEQVRQLATESYGNLKK